MSVLKEFRVTLETVTPLFLGGAEQKPEIRAPSFRGAMRYWLRALLGVQYSNSPSKIHELEEDVFGSTERSSSVIIRAKEISSTTPFDGKFSPENDPGKNYLLWTTQNTKRQAFPADTTKIELRMKCKKNDEFASAALWLLIHLGGLGTRSRRGLGSLVVSDDDEIENWRSDFPSLKFNGNNLKTFLSDGIQQWQTILNLKSSTTIQGVPSYDILHPSCSGIYVYEDQLEHWDTAIEDLGNLLIDFRGGKPPDHDGVLSVVQGDGQPSTVKRVIFGLPMQFFYRSYHEKIARSHPDYRTNRGKAMAETRGYATATITPSSKNPQNKRLERRASPVHFKFARQGDGKLILVATFFMSDFLPKDYQLRIAPGGKVRDNRKPPKFAQKPDYQLLKEFFDNPKWFCAYGKKLTGGKP